MTHTQGTVEFELHQPRQTAPQATDRLESTVNEGARKAVWLDECDPFETLVVVTSRNVYDVVVLQGDIGEVLVRGGRYFPEFRHAILAGSTAGGSALKVHRIEVGLRMELRLDDKTIVTSQVRSLSLAR